MKYPFIIFYRSEQFNSVDNFFIQNADRLDCSVFITNSLEDVKNIHNSNYHILITYGDDYYVYKNELLTIISENMLIRHIHAEPDTTIFSNVNEFNATLNEFYIHLCAADRTKTRPTFSLFTPSYNSYQKILRVYNSLLKQTLLDWEWIIIDDSPDDKHFTFLREQFSKDARIRFYRRSGNNGSIGNVKNETIGLCRGKYVLEMDHDDELLPYVLQESADLFNKDPTIGFIYFDCACVYENGKNQWYGDFICKGYGGYYSQKYDGHWRLVYITPNINNITLSHLVCCPNHPRIWRKDVLMEMGSYSEYLPICDDYEIILKTAVTTNIAKIHKLGYIQYMNESNNNFSLIRNSEINRIGPNYIYPIYFNKFNIHDKMKEKNAYEDEKYIINHSKIWERDQNTYIHKYCNQIINNDYDTQICIIGLDTILKNMDYYKELYKNPRIDFIVLENTCSLEYLQQRLEQNNFDRMKCYTLTNTSHSQLVNYFHMLYKSTGRHYEIHNFTVERPMFNTKLGSRSEIINKLTNPTNSYLEIGIEYGETFNNVHFVNKVGVDPDPKFDTTKGTIIKLTSDEYFYKKETNTIFDVIFIDGMHQTEYVLRDINNSIKCLSNDGIIFIDDILPFNYNEQLKIPIKHYYENGILKYGENWTGDVWKVVYHILLCYKDKIASFNYYYHVNFRGIGMLQIIEPFQINVSDINKINNYDYFEDFTNYIKLLQTNNK